MGKVRMLFSDLFIPEDIKQRLINAAKEGRVPHAQLIVGNEGWGGLSLALAYAQYLNCENPSSTDACGQCKACKKYQALAHPDLHFVFPVVKTPKNSKPYSSDFFAEWKNFVKSTRFHSLDEWLQFIGYENAQPSIYVHEAEEIITTLSYKAYEGRYKVMIIWKPEKMNIATANKLLKILEEPPENTVFLLISSDLEAILPTIKSRTQIIQLRPLSTTDLVNALRQEFPEAPDQDIQQAAKAASGDFITAKKFLIELTDAQQGEHFFDLFVEMMRVAYSANPLKIIDTAEKLASLDKEKIKQFLAYSLHFLRQSLMINQNIKQISQLTQKELNFAEKFSHYIHNKNIEPLANEFTRAINDLVRNGNSRLIMLDLIFTTSKLLKIK